MSAIRLAPEKVRAPLAAALHKIHNGYDEPSEVCLTRLEADALYGELERVANYVTLCGEPSTAEWAGVGPFRKAAFGSLDAAQNASLAILSAGLPVEEGDDRPAEPPVKEATE